MAVQVMLNVTQDDIDRGVRQDCSACPIARALIREFGGADKVTVSVAEERIVVFPEPGGWENRIYSETPQEAINFMGLFDDGGTVEPITLSLTFLKPGEYVQRLREARA